MTNFIATDKILRYPEEIAKLKGIVQGTSNEIPSVLNVEVDLSERCNANCIGCTFPDHRNEDMGGETLALVGRALDAWGTRAVVLTGGGEPTLLQDFDNAAGFLSCFRSLGLYTNGIKAVPDPSYFAWIYVSLDAPSDTEWGTYKRVSPALFHDVLRNIKVYGEETTCGVGFLIGPDNYKDVARMADVGLANGASYVHFRPRYPVRSNDWELDCYEYLHDIAEMEHVQVAWDKFEDGFHWERNYRTCWASMFLRQIDAAGNVWACPTTRWLRKLGHVSELQKLSYPVPVTEHCRELCRGHRMNQLLQRILSDAPHKEFV
jgi:MoaA/NifB/PqqE/SkfB family radical SAM enzyme